MSLSRTTVLSCFIIVLSINVGAAAEKSFTKYSERNFTVPVEHVNCYISNAHLTVEVMYYSHWYVGKLPSSQNYKINDVSNDVDAGKFSILSIMKKEITLKTQCGVTIILQNSDSKHWFHVGHIDDFDDFKKMYPFNEYLYGVTYNSYQVQQVRISHWNHGTRVAIVETYPYGDDAKTFQRGSAMWTKGTVDSQSQTNSWKHWYVKYNYEQFWSNGYGGVQMYVRFA